MLLFQVTYSLFGTDRFIVNPTTGDVTLAEPLDREVIFIKFIKLFNILMFFLTFRLMKH